MKELIQRILKYYWFEIVIAVFTIWVALAFVFDTGALVSAIARKTAIWGAGLVLYYVARYLKVGKIEWSAPYDKIYSLAILLYTALIFAFA